MIDFVGRSRSPLDDMQQWNQYFGQDAARAQEDWQNREVRNRYDEAARYNREGAASDAQSINAAATGDTFQGMDSQLAGLRPENVPQAHIASATSGVTPQGPDSLAPGVPGGPAGATGPLPMADVRGDYNAATTTPTALFSDRVARNNPRVADYARTFNQVIQGRMNPEPLKQNLDVLVRQRLITQTQANRHYTDILNYIRDTRGPGTGDLRVRSNVDVSNTQTTGNRAIASGTPSAIAAIPPPTDNTSGLGSTDLGAPVDLHGDSNANTVGDIGGLEPPTDYQGTNDTSRGLTPTREMRILQTNIQDQLRRADIAARHGDRAGAQTAFAQALQGQASYLSQSRAVLYRAAANGSNDAMSTLIAEFNGYPPGTVRLQPTDERRTRFNMQVQRNDGTWVTAHETPHTRNELLGGLQDLIDAEGATARTEATNELMRAQVTAGAQITVASINYRGQLMHELTAAQIAALDSRTKIALQNGEGQLLVNPQDGSAYLRYSGTDAHGNRTVYTDVIRNQNVQTPGVDGNRTTQMPVRTRVTGTTGVTANEGANQ